MDDQKKIDEELEYAIIDEEEKLCERIINELFANVKSDCEKFLSEEEIKGANNVAIEYDMISYIPSEVLSWPTYRDCDKYTYHVQKFANQINRMIDEFEDQNQLLYAYISRYEREEKILAENKDRYNNNLEASLQKVEDRFGKVTLIGSTVDYRREMYDRLAMLMQDRDKFSEAEFADIVADIVFVYDSKIQDRKHKMRFINQRAKDEGRKEVYSEEDFVGKDDLIDPSRVEINANAQRALYQVDGFICLNKDTVSDKLKALKGEIFIYGRNIGVYKGEPGEFVFIPELKIKPGDPVV